MKHVPTIHVNRFFEFAVVRLVPLSRTALWDYGVADVRLLQRNHVKP